MTGLEQLYACVGTLLDCWYPNERVTKIGTVQLFGTLLNSGNVRYCSKPSCSARWKRGYSVVDWLKV